MVGHGLQVITPGNITAAALVMQLCLCVVIFIGGLVLRGGEYEVVYRDTSSILGHFRTMLLFSLLTIGLLLLSDELSILWKPLFGEVPYEGIRWSTALLAVFLCDILWVSMLVWATGGSSDSAFAPIYFILPALAIFLRESLGHLILYVALITAAFTINLVFNDASGDSVGGPRRPHAYWCVSIASFILATLIGFVTRPR